MKTDKEWADEFVNMITPRLEGVCQALNYALSKDFIIKFEIREVAGTQQVAKLEISKQVKII